VKEIKNFDAICKAIASKKANVNNGVQTPKEISEKLMTGARKRLRAVSQSEGGVQPAVPSEEAGSSDKMDGNMMKQCLDKAGNADVDYVGSASDDCSDPPDE